MAPPVRFPVVRGWGTCPCVCRENWLRHERDTPQPSPVLIPNGGYWRLCFKPLLQIKQNRNFSPDLSRPGELPRCWLLSPAFRLFSRGASQGAGPRPSAGHQPVVRIQPCFPKAPLTSSSPSASEQAKDTPTHTRPRPFPTHRRPAGPGGRTGTPSGDRVGRAASGAGERGRGGDTQRAGTQRPGAAPGRADARARGSRLLLRRRAGDAVAGLAAGAPRSAEPPRRGGTGHPRWAKPRGWGTGGKQGGEGVSSVLQAERGRGAGRVGGGC